MGKTSKGFTKRKGGRVGGATKGSKKGVNEWGKKTKKLKVKEHKLSGPVTVQRYKEFGFGGEEDFWKELTTVEVLKKVRDREVGVKALKEQKRKLLEEQRMVLESNYSLWEAHMSTRVAST